MNGMTNKILLTMACTCLLDFQGKTMEKLHPSRSGPTHPIDTAEATFTATSYDLPSSLLGMAQPNLLGLQKCSVLRHQNHCRWLFSTEHVYKFGWHYRAILNCCH